MTNVFDRLEQLTEVHCASLLWFHDRKRKEVPWPAPMPDGTFLVNRAKGIHKPKGWHHALSIRQALISPYQDHEPEVRADGSWTYAYFQEGESPEDRDRYFTNRALLACQRDRVPVGVLRQTRVNPVSRYLVLGLALVRDWQDGYFLLEGLPSNGRLPPDAEAEDLAFKPASLEDARQWIRTAIVRRRGQPRFRAELIQAYEGQCAVTGCTAIDVLEAAHIVPYLGEQTNVAENGLLLRADIHTLFDLGLISIDSISMYVVVHGKLAETEYAEFSGKRVFTPRDPAKRPSGEALEEHSRRVQFGGVDTGEAVG